MTISRWRDRLIEAVPADARLAVASDAESALVEHFDLTVVAAESFAKRGDAGWCDGTSITEAGLVMYRPTHSRRQNFTLCHELGHHLVDFDDDCLVWLADQPEPGRAREQLCDAIAAQLLVPSETRKRIFGGNKPSAYEFVELFYETNASRSACAVAVAEILPCDGFAMLVSLDEPDRVFFAARTRETRPYPWSGDQIPAGHPVSQDVPPQRARAWWESRGHGRRNMYMTAALDGDWVFAVFAEHNLWGIPGGSFVDAGEQDRGFDGTVQCPCGYNGATRWWPCSTCGTSSCPRCQTCACDRDTTERAMCNSCTATVRADQLVDGYCTGCR